MRRSCCSGGGGRIALCRRPSGGNCIMQLCDRACVRQPRAAAAGCDIRCLLHNPSPYPLCPPPPPLPPPPAHPQVLPALFMVIPD